MIYLDNAATSYPKPGCVWHEMQKYLSCGNPGRGAHKLAVWGAEKVYETRSVCAKMFGCEAENVVFTSGATMALNIAIKGLVPDSCHIITTDIEHNSVRRPLFSLCKHKNCSVSYADTRFPEAVPSLMEKLIRPDTRAIVCTHASNIVNRVLPIYEIGKMAERHGLIFIVDASQSVGKYEINVKKAKINALAIAGHKGLMGPMGVGLLVIDGKYSVKTLLEGGSGSQSELFEMPSELPDRLEAGTLPLPAIAGLCSGIKYVSNVGIDRIREHEEKLYDIAVANLRYATVFEKEKRGSNILFRVDGMTPAETAKRLDALGVCVRSGMHCAPDAHNSVGSGEKGAVRASIGPLTSEGDVRVFADIVNSFN